MMKRIVIMVLLLSISLSFVIVNPGIAAAENGANYEKAVDLKILGLFLGSDKGFDLNLAPTRAQGANMLVRLLGKDQEAKNLKLKHPFTDVPSWADYQVGYMYQNGLTLGSGNNKFGSSDQLTVQQYVTFVLRALGYSEKNGDFTSGGALDKAIEIGLLSASEASTLKSKQPFLRDDLVGISHNAINVKLKSSYNTLLDKLVTTDKVVSKDAATILGFHTADLKDEIDGITDFTLPSTSNGYAIKDATEYFKLLRKAFYLNETQISIDTGTYNGNAISDFDTVSKRAQDAVTKSTGVENFFKGWSYDYKGSSLKYTFEYKYTRNQFLEIKQQAADAIFKARHIVLDITKPDMADFDKELAIHKYIIGNSRYDNENYLAGTLPESAYNAYGCLIAGSAACQGYAEAVKLLCDMSNLECKVVNGKSVIPGKQQGHSWNIIKIKGQYYHMDTAFDDPVSPKNENLLTYHHLNITDSEMAKLCDWDKSLYPSCSSTESNYYVKSKLVVNDLADFEKYALKALSGKKKQFEVKIKNYISGSLTDPTQILFRDKSVSSFKYSINQYFGIVSIYNIEY